MEAGLQRSATSQQRGPNATGSLRRAASPARRRCSSNTRDQVTSQPGLPYWWYAGRGQVTRAALKRSDPLMQSSRVQLSKFLSLVLRHKPEAIGLTLDPQGWAAIDELITKSDASGTKFNRDDLLQVVETSDKKRFSLSEDGQRIRAAQGHSVAVELGLSPQEPPSILYHGTATRFVDSILSEGIKPQSRQQVHLSADEATAYRVGQRHGKPFILKIEALRMHTKGFQFFLADNGVWLTDQVPPEFLSPSSSSTADSATTSRQPKLSM